MAVFLTPDGKILVPEEREPQLGMVEKPSKDDVVLNEDEYWEYDDTDTEEEPVAFDETLSDNNDQSANKIPLEKRSFAGRHNRTTLEKINKDHPEPLI